MRRFFTFTAMTGALFTLIASVSTASAITIITPPDPSAYARLFVNDSKIAYVEYGGSVNLRWESNKMSSCIVNPINQSGKSGQYELQNITSNMQVTVSCITNSGIPYSASGRSRDVSVNIKVMPPTFTHLEGYLTQMQSDSGKKINLTSTLIMLDHAQKAYSSDKNDSAASFLRKSINNLNQSTKQEDTIADLVNDYEQAATYLGKTLPVRLSLAEDGCSVAASGPAGLTLQYGGHELGLAGDIIAIFGIGPDYPKILGYQSSLTIPDGESATASIPSRSGWTSFGVVSDSDGLIYAVKTVGVEANCL